MITEERKRQLEVENKAISDAIDVIGHGVVVLSGKGGVGKSTVSVNLTHALYRGKKTTGLPGVDVSGPDVPKLVGMDGELNVRDRTITPSPGDGGDPAVFPIVCRMLEDNGCSEVAIRSERSH